MYKNTSQGSRGKSRGREWRKSGLEVMVVIGLIILFTLTKPSVAEARSIIISNGGQSSSYEYYPLKTGVEWSVYNWKDGDKLIPKFGWQYLTQDKKYRCQEVKVTEANWQGYQIKVQDAGPAPNQGSQAIVFRVSEKEAKNGMRIIVYRAMGYKYANGYVGRSPGNQIWYKLEAVARGEKALSDWCSQTNKKFLNHYYLQQDNPAWKRLWGQ